jgi:hypothetical protein
LPPVGLGSWVLVRLGVLDDGVGVRVAWVVLVRGALLDADVVRGVVAAPAVWRAAVDVVVDGAPVCSVVGSADCGGWTTTVVTGCDTVRTVPVGPPPEDIPR